MADDNKFEPMVSDLPARVAEAFVLHMSAEAVLLRFDEASLIGPFGSVLEHQRERFKKVSLDVGGVSFDLETAAGCYFGETLRRLYAGTWLGRLHSTAGLNFYTAKIQFGDY